MKRRYFLGLVGLSLSSAAATLRGAAAQTGPGLLGQSIKSFGAVGDGVTDDGPALKRACEEATDGVLSVPPGDYLIGNPLNIRGFSGVLLFEAGARLQYASVDRPGLTFTEGARAQLIDYRAGWRDAPVSRLPVGGGVEFQNSTDPALINPVIENSNSAGIIFYQCIRPSVVGARVSNTKADGIHFANCEAPRAEECQTNDTGDDGLAFVNYAGGANYRGGYARSIVVQRSRARGISVVGQSDVEVHDFEVLDTSSSGIMCAVDVSFNTRVPDNVLFRNGRVDRAGTFVPPIGNQYGIELEAAGAVALESIAVSDSLDRGLSVSLPNGSVRARGITISRPRRGSGVEIRAKLADIDGLEVEGAPQYGVFVSNTALTAGTITAIDCGSAFALARAVWFEGNSNIEVGTVAIVDSRLPARGNVIGAAGGTRGRVGAIRYRIADTAGLRIENNVGGGLVLGTPAAMALPAAPTGLNILQQ